VLLAAALAAGCFLDIDELRPLGGEGGASAASASTGSAAATTSAAGGSAGAPSSGPCNDGSGQACSWSCPAGTTCVDGCCRVEQLPGLCDQAIDVSDGGRFYWDGCGMPPTFGEYCRGVTAEAALFVEGGPSDFGYGFQIQLSNPEIWMLPVCGMSSIFCSQPANLAGVAYVVLEDDSTVALVPEVACEPLVFDVCTRLSTMPALCQL
jgi:hypothetical protein